MAAGAVAHPSREAQLLELRDQLERLAFRLRGAIIAAVAAAIEAVGGLYLGSSGASIVMVVSATAIAALGVALCGFRTGRAFRTMKDVHARFERLGYTRRPPRDSGVQARVVVLRRVMPRSRERASRRRAGPRGSPARPGDDDSEDADVARGGA